MGGFGSGRGQGGKDTTSDMQPLDVRRLQRGGLLTPGGAFAWHWTVNGKEVASIQVRTEVDRVILNYQSRSNGGEWQPMEYPVTLEWTHCHLGGQARFFRAHLQPWAGALCEAVVAHPGARVYRALADFTNAFVQVETQAFDLAE